MNLKPFLKKYLWKIAMSLFIGAWLSLAGSASAQMAITTASQLGLTGVWPFTPTWTPAVDSLIAGLAPTTMAGNFSQEVTGRNVNSLTAGGSLTINQVPATVSGNNTCSTNYVTYGNGAGSLLIYTLPASAKGYNLTNITVDGGWANSGRDQLAFTVLYSTMANPTNFIYLATVNYNPSVPNNTTPSADQAVINNAAGGLIAANVAAVEFILNFPAVENSYGGLGAITVEGTAATSNVLAVAINTSNQNGANPLTPTWSAETPNLIAGLLPSSSNGNFGLEASGGLPVLTDGAIGHSGTIGGFATCGTGGGTTLIYTLTNTVNGTDVTNIVVYSGWGDTGRFAQYYTLSYSTVSAPTTFIPITTVFYWPGTLAENGGGSAQANRVSIFTSTGAKLAGSVANLKFDFSGPPSAGSFNNGYQGYSEIIVQGNDTASPPLPPSPLLSQDILPTYASTVPGDQVIFTTAYSNAPPASLQWIFVSGGVTNVLAGQTGTTLTLNNVQVTNSGAYLLEAFNATNNAATPSLSTAGQLVVNSAPVAVNNIILNYAEQAGLGPISPVNASTNFYPTWTVDTANDLIVGSPTNASPGVPGTYIAGLGSFNLLTGGNAPCNPDPTILSDGSNGYIPYWPNVGGNLTLCSCGVGGAGDTITYTLPNSAANGFDLTNITVYGGWGDQGRNEQKYQVLYSTIYNPTAFTSLGTFDYNPNDPANQPSATRTMLIPVSGALAKNVYAVEINWNVAVAPKNNWEGYSEVMVKGTPSLANPILVQDTLPAYAETMVGDQVTFTVTFSNSPAANLQWQFIGTNNIPVNIPGATAATLTLSNVQFTNVGSYRLQAINPADSSAITYSTAASLVVSNVPSAINNIITTTAGQSGLGAISGFNASTNFAPTWLVNTDNDLILNSQDGNLNSPGSVYSGGGYFSVTGSGCNGDPAILSDGDQGYQNYYPGTGGNNTLDTLGPYLTTPGVQYGGVSLTYTLPNTAGNTGWSLTNIVVYGGWGDSTHNEQKYQVYYSTVAAPNTFISLTGGWVDYVPGNPNGTQSATRTTLTPVSGALAQNVYAVQFSFNDQAAPPKGNWSGYSEFIVSGQVSPNVPILTQNITPATAEDVVGSSLILTASFNNADSYQWQKNGTNISGANSSTLTLNNLQLTDTATNGGYSLVASNAAGGNMSAACAVVVDPAPLATNSVVTAFAYQTSAAIGFGPTWDTSALSSSLINGQNPSSSTGDFTGAGDLASRLPVLTDGSYGTFANDGTHPAFATGGPGAGNYAVYNIGGNANGYDITNIQVASGWNDNGRDSLYYNVSYSTVANPTLFFPLASVANDLNSPPYGVGDETVVRSTLTSTGGLLASNVYAIQVDFTWPVGVPNGYSGYSEISVFGSPSAAMPPISPVITAENELTNNNWVVETPNLIANQLPSSYGAGVFTEEGCNETNLTDGMIGFGAPYGASCGDDGIAVPWIIFSPVDGGSWNLTNIVVYTLWHDYGRDGQFYNLSYSTASAPTTFLPLASVAYNPIVPENGTATGNRVAIAPPIGQTMLASNVAAVKFDFTPQGTQDFGWSGYSEIVLQGNLVAPLAIGTTTVSSGNLILTGAGGTPNRGYTWLTTTNLTTPLANWTVSLTGVFDSNGAFSNSIPVDPAKPASFFRLRTP